MAAAPHDGDGPAENGRPNGPIMAAIWLHRPQPFHTLSPSKKSRDRPVDRLSIDGIIMATINALWRIELRPIGGGMAPSGPSIHRTAGVLVERYFQRRKWPISMATDEAGWRAIEDGDGRADPLPESGCPIVV